MADKFRCTLVTPECQVLDEEVVYASIPAWDGQVGLMTLRAPLMVEMGCGVLRVDSAEGGSQSFYVGAGFAQMQANHLTLVADEATPSDQIDREEAEAELREAQAYIAHTDEDHGRNLRDQTRARARISLSKHS